MRVGSLRRFVGQLCSELATVSLLVFATQMVPGGSTATTSRSLGARPELEARRRRGIYYAIFLSFLDIGDSVSDWITAPIVQYLGLTWDNFSSVRQVASRHVVWFGLLCGECMCFTRRRCMCLHSPAQ